MVVVQAPNPRQKGGNMSTDPVEYPTRWRPKDAPPFPEPEPAPELEPLAAELWLASLDQNEFDAVIKRTRGGRS
jgi:hypothetical protein